MSVGVKFYSFVEKLGQGVFDFDNDEICIYLTNATPDVANDTVKADLAEIATGNGYTGPISIDADWTQAGGISTLSGNAVTTIAAAGGPIGPFRYVVAIDNTVLGKPLISYWDYGAQLTINDGSDFKFNLDDPPTVMVTVQ